MCGRFAAKKALSDLAKFYNATTSVSGSHEGSYNICPTELSPIVIEDQNQNRTIQLAKFGIPITAGGKSFPLLNIRSEKAGDRKDFNTNRCVVPVDGFFEWANEEGSGKQPYYFSPTEGFFSFAGIYKQSGDSLTFAILTTEANELLTPMHDRMPVILGHNAIGDWLAFNSDNNMLKELLRAYPSGLMGVCKVSRQVNSPKFKEPQCVQPIQ